MLQKNKSSSETLNIITNVFQRMNTIEFYLSPSHTYLTTWSGYRGIIHKLSDLLQTPSGTTLTWGASTWTGGASGASGGDTCLLREDEATNAWILKVYAFASNELESIGCCKSKFLSLQTDACCYTLPSLNLSWLSAIVPIIKPHKYYIVEKNQILVEYKNAFQY